MWAALRARRPEVEAFGYCAKAAAIDRAWREREADFAAFQAVHAAGDIQAMLDWCASILFVGNITKYQLTKNVGFDVCKPDICWRVSPACRSVCRSWSSPHRSRRPSLA